MSSHRAGAAGDLQASGPKIKLTANILTANILTANILTANILTGTEQDTA